MKSFVNAKKLLGLVVVVLTGLWLINVSVHANPNDPPGTPGAGGAITVNAECLTKGCSGAVAEGENACESPMLACGENVCGLCDGMAIITVCWHADDKSCHKHKTDFAINFAQCGDKRSTNCVIKPSPSGGYCGCPSVPNANDPIIMPCRLKICTHTTGGPQLP